ncbi:MAG: muconolactone Delta-isomerase family protein [Nitrososphaerales archaeon]|nr:muconolactone Delta-isomerase family protein [Nitrososphaerales archaeon]
MKFLVFWSLQSGLKLGPELAKIIFDLQDYAKELRELGKLERYYHVIGKHGGVWIFDVESNNELEALVAKMPVYNYATYEIYPLTEMRA